MAERPDTRTLEDVSVEVAVRHNEPFTVTAPPAAVARRSARAPRATDEQEAGDLGKGERIILTAIAQHKDGVTREQLTVLTGYKRATRNTYLQRLGAIDGVLSIDGDRIFALRTDLLGQNFQPLPTGAALLEHWRRELPEGERAVLDAAVGVWPRSIDRESVTQTTGYKRATRNTYIQRLAARQLLADVGHGEVRASDMLFDGAAR